MGNDLTGQRLGKYEILSEIGHGGMGSVYKGYDPVLDRPVAIKVLASHLVREEEFVERFMREARAAARLQHPNLVTIYDVGQDDGVYYFVMEHLEGKSLTQFIQQQGALSPEKAFSFLRPLAEALDYAHKQGLVHRDVKPSNIVVDTAGRATLTDFGIARAAQDTKLTKTGTILGTPEYMSPEQVQGENIGPRSDQYSLAVVAFELLSGRVPFQAESTVALLHKVAYEPPPPISEVQSGLPRGVEHVLNRALSKNPRDRYKSARDFVDALRNALSGKKIVEATQAMDSEDITSSTISVADSNRQAKEESTAGKSSSIPVWIWIVAGGVLVSLTVGLAKMFIFPSLPSEVKPTVTQTFVPTDTLTPAPSPTQTFEPTSTPALPSLELSGPDDGAEYPTVEQVTLAWNWNRSLDSDERFRIICQGPTGDVVLTATIAAGSKQEFTFMPEEEGLDVGRYMWYVEVEQQQDETWVTAFRSEPRALEITVPIPTATSYGSSIILPPDLMGESPVPAASAYARMLAFVAPLLLLGFFVILEFWATLKHISFLVRRVSVSLKSKE